ncbi:MAG TPA: lasso RiPP family leader peptide-containing protein [Longimicrobium sp.]|nr:lasso RiPP family leader peptide-containing protein [Longimicrobium sp.]
MEPMHPQRRPYEAPRLAVYGRLEELTLTNANPKNKNDVIQGHDNLKT